MVLRESMAWPLLQREPLVIAAVHSPINAFAQQACWDVNVMGNQYFSFQEGGVEAPQQHPEVE